MDKSVKDAGDILIQQDVLEGSRAVDKALSNAEPMLPQSAINLRRLSSIKSEKIDWIFAPYIARGKVTLISGNPGQGKSTLAADWIARISSGTPFPGQDAPQVQASDVIALLGEDGFADTVRPRIEAAGGDLKRIEVANATKIDKAELTFSIQRDVERLKIALRHRPECVAVFIDPLAAFLGVQDANRDTDVRSALQPLAKFAEENRIAVVLIGHLNKSVGLDAIYRAGGSMGIVAAVRLAFIVAQDKQDASRKLLLSVKSNVHKTSKGKAFRLVSADSNPQVAILRWEEDDIEITADEAMTPVNHDTSPHAVGEAMEFLQDILGEGPLEARVLQAEASEQGISKSRLNRAKQKLGIRSQKVGDGWKWVMPPQDAQGTQPPEQPDLPNVEDLGEGLTH